MKRNAFVTGSGSGIGRAVCHELSQAGYTVAGYDLTPDPASPCDVQYTGDVRDRDALRSAIDGFADQFGLVHCLVPCAGVTAKAQLAEMSEDQVDRLIDINLRGTIWTCQAAIPRMADGSAMVLIGSSLTHTPVRGLSIYSASKGAIEAFTRNLALDLAPKVRVNAVAPGLTETPIWTSAGMNPGDFEALVAARSAEFPMKRVGQPADIARAIAFLASDKADWITGVYIPVDGGVHL